MVFKFNGFHITREQVDKIFTFPEQVRRNLAVHATYLVGQRVRYGDRYVTGDKTQMMLSNFTCRDEGYPAYLSQLDFFQVVHVGRVDWWLDADTQDAAQMMCRLENNTNSAIRLYRSTVNFAELDDPGQVNVLDFSTVEVNETCAINPPTSTVFTCNGSLIINPNGTFSCDGGEITVGARNLP